MVFQSILINIWWISMPNIIVNTWKTWLAVLPATHHWSCTPLHSQPRSLLASQSMGPVLVWQVPRLPNQYSHQSSQWEGFLYETLCCGHAPPPIKISDEDGTLPLCYGHAPLPTKVANGQAPPPINRTCEQHTQPPLHSYQRTKEPHPIVYSEKMPMHISLISHMWVSTGIFSLKIVSCPPAGGQENLLPLPHPCTF